MREKIFVKSQPLGYSDCRELAEESFEMMKNISRENHEKGSGNIFHQVTHNVSWILTGLPGHDREKVEMYRMGG